MNQEDEEIVRGTLERVTYRNAENGYAVLQVVVPDKRERVTVVGTYLSPKIGADLVVRGNFISHPKFGRQLSATSITETVPTTTTGIQKYLSSGLIKGIGEKTAERIIEQFGDKTLEMIHRSPEELAKVPGVGKHKAELLSQALNDQKDMGAIIQFLVEHNVSPRLATKIYERFRNHSLEVLNKDPYVLARSMRGVGFATADSIAMNLGLPHDSPQRLKAGLYFALEKAADDGHCFLKLPELIKRARNLLGIDESLSLEEPLTDLIKEDFIIEHGGGYFIIQYHRAEEFVSSFVAHRAQPLDDPLMPEHHVSDALRSAETDLGITFSPQQNEAVKLANRFPLLLITGGPGCGKTTVIRALSHFFKEAGKILLLAAPTGRAAQRMSQVCGVPASTIHRMLRYDPSGGGFLHGINDPLMADAIIVDEASMIDVQLAKDLFSAIGRKTTLILVGDKDQLPSVGPGRVFADLLTIKEVKSIVLSQLFRRSEESAITTVAHLINSGIEPEIPEPDGVTKTDTYFIPRKSSEESALIIEKLVSEQIPKRFGFVPTDITVLTPSNRGPLGTIALNAALQAKLNPPGDKEQELEFNNIIFRANDRVCQRVNNYQIDSHGVYNGDTGTIYSINKRDRSLVVELWDGRLVTYEPGDISQLSHAYAITVHRSQGAEMPCVVLALDNSHYTLLERQLFYTAVTRAKELLIVVGSRQAVSMATKRATSSKRCTMIRERVRAILDG